MQAFLNLEMPLEKRPSQNSLKECILFNFSSCVFCHTSKVSYMSKQFGSFYVEYFYKVSSIVEIYDVIPREIVA